MNQANTILGLMAQTSIHAGTGQNTGIIDLPIQREGHNGWPCVYGSAVKGALRALAEEKIADEVTHIFGPEMNKAEEHAGALLISDARIILYPVRSLTSQFKWITCPAALTRLQNDMQRFDQKTTDIEDLGSINSNECISHTEIDSDIFLEEYRYRSSQQKLSETIKLLSKLSNQKDFSKNLKEQLLILNNDSFTYLVQHATPVNAHIAIDSKTKTVTGGALWYEETLPPETLLYIGLSASDARNDSGKTADDILESTTKLFKEKPWLQIGGNETVGMGWCAVKNVKEEAKDANHTATKS